VRDAEKEVREHVCAARRVHDLGVKLQPVEAALRVHDDRVRTARRRAEANEAGGQPFDAVAVAHPHLKLLFGVEALEQEVARGVLDFGATVLVMIGADDAPAEHVAHQLEPVADAEHGNAELEDRAIDGG
jgi:hypothetical protein